MTAYIRDNTVPAQRQFLKHLHVVPIVCSGETPSQNKDEGLMRRTCNFSMLGDGWNSNQTSTYIVLVSLI